VNTAEQEIYDLYIKEIGVAFEKAKAASSLIGSDFAALIGKVEEEKAVVVIAAKKDIKTVWGWLSAAWKWLMAWTQILDDPRNNKFSHKRVIALAAAVVAIRQLVIGDKWGAAGAGLAAVILGVVSAVTRT